jgi:hypothetical protein
LMDELRKMETMITGQESRKEATGCRGKLWRAGHLDSHCRPPLHTVRLGKHCPRKMQPISTAVVWLTGSCQIGLVPFLISDTSLSVRCPRGAHSVVSFLATFIIKPPRATNAQSRNRPERQSVEGEKRVAETNDMRRHSSTSKRLLEA